MNKRTIEILIAPGGGITIDAVGFKGADCEQATKFLEQALGQVTTKRHKPEFNERGKVQRRQKVGS